MNSSSLVELAADVDELARLSAAVEELGERERWPVALLFKVQLVVEEIVLNSITHSQSTNRIAVSVSSTDRSVSLEVSDDGQAFDPLTDAPEPDLDSALAEREVGGLGVHLIVEMADEVDYARVDGQNRLKMSIRRDD